MPKLEFTQSEINGYSDQTYKHIYRDCSEKDAKEICVHANGEQPIELLTRRRPNEPLEVKEYRECIWEPITQEPISKVIASLQKIRRSPDYVIKYPDQDAFQRIPDGAKLEDYCEYNFPYFRSVTNWMFGLYLRKYLLDANSVIFIRPMEMTDKFGFVQPVPEIFSSCHVIDMVEDDYCILENPNGCYYREGDAATKGRSFYIITTQFIAKYNQVSGNKFVPDENVYYHGLGILPAFKTPSQIKDICEGRIYNCSRIDGMVCHLNEAAREYSDLQAAKVNHMYPERWEFTQNECTNCKGTGKRNNPQWTAPGCGCDQFLTCEHCRGTGYAVAGPFAKILVRPVNNVEGQTQIPMPPAGYIEKDVEIIKVQEESVNAHIYKALSSVNMEYLSQVPMNQSGVAKEVDRDESRNTIHSVAEDLVNAMDRIYYINAKYRYGAAVGDAPALYNDEEIRSMLPQIPVPERFDLITAGQALTEIKLAKDSKTNPVLITALEIDFASKKFSTDPEIKDQLVLELELDPMPNLSEDDKNSRLQNNGITQETYVISSNIHEFVLQALDEYPDFASWPQAKQREQMQTYAAEIMNDNSTTQTIIGDAEPVVNGNNQSNQQIPGSVQQTVAEGAAVDAAGSLNGTQAAGY